MKLLDQSVSHLYQLHKNVNVWKNNLPRLPWVLICITVSSGFHITSIGHAHFPPQFKKLKKPVTL